MPEKSFSEKCQKCPDHNSVCYGCLNQVNTFATIRDFLMKMEDQWLQHKFELAVKDVLEYKKHIVRAIHQDRAKADLMERLSTEEVLLIFDYAMKFLPQKFREAQTDFFAKTGKIKTNNYYMFCCKLIIGIRFLKFCYLLFYEGLSWHIMVCLWKTPDGQLNLKTMVYLMGNIKQVYFVYCILLYNYLSHLHMSTGLVQCAKQC